MAFLGIDLVVLRVRSLSAASEFYAEKFGVPVGPGVLPTSRTLFLAGGPHVDLVEGPVGSAEGGGGAGRGAEGTAEGAGGEGSGIEGGGRPGESEGVDQRVQLRMVVDDLDLTYAGFRRRGVEVLRPPTALPGGAREMLAVDLDGNRWRFTEPQPHRTR